jgi:CHAD domain-containing protein
MSDSNTRSDRSATGVVRRAALQHVANAERALASLRPSGIQVHRARKEIKRSRAALRLLRAALPVATYQREDAALRGAARTLNAVRDARVLVRTLDSLCRRSLALGRQPAVVALSRRLRASQAQAQRQLTDRRAALAGARATLQQVQRRARRWRIGRHGWSRLGPGFQRIYRAGRRAGRAARRHPDTLALHEWRKQVQYLWHALQMLRPLQSRARSRSGARARRLADCLGHEHDLALLQSTVAAYRQSTHSVIDPLQGAIESRRRTLRVKAMALGKRLYALKPRAMALRLGRSCVRSRS